MHDFLVQEQSGDKLKMSMAGFILKNTLSDNGAVNRGVCKVDSNVLLVFINLSVLFSLIIGLFFVLYMIFRGGESNDD